MTKPLCTACLVLIAFRWSEVDCPACNRLSTTEGDRSVA